MPTSGPIKTKDGYSIEVDRNLCATLAVCLGFAPDVYELDAEGKAVIKNPDGADIQTHLETARACPLNAIIIKHPNGKQIWPDPEVGVDGSAIA
jgi:ferredoxin